MLCQNCRKNEADRTFVASWLGGQYEIHLCQECLEQMWHYAGAMGQREAFRSFTGWQPGQEAPRETGHHPFPQEAGPELKLRLRLSALRARLAETARREEFEEAAKLRDRIAAIETEAYSHES